jgi:hypothetical protein
MKEAGTNRPFFPIFQCLHFMITVLVLAEQVFDTNKLKKTSERGMAIG